MKNTAIINIAFCIILSSCALYYFVFFENEMDFGATRSIVIIARNVMTLFIFAYSIVGMFFLRALAGKYGFVDFSINSIWKIVNSFSVRRSNKFEILVFFMYVLTGLFMYIWVSLLFTGAAMNLYFALYH